MPPEPENDDENPPIDWPTARLHVVTGKGGAGKSTVAAAMALALAAGGRRTLLTEVEGRQGIARIFEVPPLPYAETGIAAAAGDGEVLALPVDAEDALLDYLEMFYRLGRAGKVLKRFGAIDFATTIAPGVRDVLLTGKVKEAVTRSEAGRRRYDAVVLDAPPTGRIGRFLNVTAEVSGLAKVGPIKSQSDGVAAVLHSPMTAVHVVTLLEEMPVQECVDTLDELRRLSIPVGSVVVNSVRADHPNADLKPTQTELKRGLKLAGLPADRDTAVALAQEVADHRTRIDLERRLRAELDRVDEPVLELPYLPGGVGRDGLTTLAAELAAAGVRPRSASQPASQPGSQPGNQPGSVG